MATRRWTPWLLLGTWMALITLGSLSPGVGAPSGVDVLVHGFAYAVLAWLARRAFQASRAPATPAVVPLGLLAAGFACLVGLLIEGLQTQLAFRSAEAHDLVANGIGAVAGALWRRRPGTA